jgi:hypothetical protein
MAEKLDFLLVALKVVNSVEMKVVILAAAMVL